MVVFNEFNDHQTFQVPKMEVLSLIKVSTSILGTWNVWWNDDESHGKK